jgi:hypothetical protein
VIELKSGTRIWVAAGFTDLRRGFQGLSSIVETVLEQAPFSGQLLQIAGVIFFAGGSSKAAAVCSLSPSMLSSDLHTGCRAEYIAGLDSFRWSTSQDSAQPNRSNTSVA